jgi:hypothetical protein
MKKLCIILNGPAGIGKDTIGKLLIDYINDCTSSKAGHFEFKKSLMVDTIEYYNLYHCQLAFKEACADRDLKDQSFLCPYGREINHMGLSPRKMLIHVSENVVKRRQGKGIYGSRLAAMVDDALVDVAIITDGGFPEEVLELEKEHDVIVVRLFGPNFSFMGDARAYVESADPERTIQILRSTEATPEYLLNKILKKLGGINVPY